MSAHAQVSIFIEFWYLLLTIKHKITSYNRDFDNFFITCYPIPTTFSLEFLFSGSFEVTINNQLVYSKLATLAYPDFDAVTDAIMNVTAGEIPQKIEKQQPITDCCLM